MNIKAMLKLIVLLIFGVFMRQVQASETSQEIPEKSVVTVFFVQHAEMNLNKTTIPLTPEGEIRASRLVRTFSQVPLTNIYASHTLRARQTVFPVAEAKTMEVNEFPQLGSSIDGQVIWDAAPSALAIRPLFDAIDKLPQGSKVLVAVNSNNLFAVMNLLGVRQGSDIEPCELGGTCVPCLDNSCFPDGFDGLWILTRDNEINRHQLVWLKY
jgi:hypothetical protein